MAIKITKSSKGVMGSGKVKGAMAKATAPKGSSEKLKGGNKMPKMKHNSSIG